MEIENKKRMKSEINRLNKDTEIKMTTPKIKDAKVKSSKMIFTKTE